MARARLRSGERGDVAALVRRRRRAWPSSWDGGELIASGVVEPGARALLGPAYFDEAEQIDALLGVAVCAGADLELEVRAEVTADLGVRAVAEALSVELWRAD